MLGTLIHLNHPCIFKVRCNNCMKSYLFLYCVFFSDVDRGEIFSLIHRNFKRNKALVKAETLVKELDFDNHATIDENSESLKDISIILAADSEFPYDSVLRYELPFLEGLG